MRCRNTGPLSGEYCLTTAERFGRTEATSGTSTGRCTPDGPPLDKEVIRDTIEAVRRCLIRGWWRCAEAVLLSTRQPNMTSEMLLSLRVKDGPKLSEESAGTMSRLCWVWLAANHNATFAAVALMRRQADPDWVSVIGLESSVCDLLSSDIRLANTLEKYGLNTVSDVVRECDEWYRDHKTRPRSIHNTAQANIAQELRRHGLLGPIAAAYFEYVSHTAGVQNLGKGRPVKETA